MEEKGIFNEVELLNEEGTKVRFDHVMTFNYEAEKYIALLPLEDTEGIGHDEVLLMKIVQKDGEDVYETIKNEVLLEEVFDRFIELYEELEDDEENEGDYSE